MKCTITLVHMFIKLSSTKIICIFVRAVSDLCMKIDKDSCKLLTFKTAANSTRCPLRFCTDTDDTTSDIRTILLVVRK